MSAKSRKSSKPKAIDRPFDPKIMRRAKEIAAGYQIILHYEDGAYYGRGLELPGAMDDGRTPDECVTNTRSALEALVAYMLEEGEVPPSPASEHKRTEQINIRVSPEEKLLLEEAARSKGFRGVSDYVRNAGLSKS